MVMAVRRGAGEKRVGHAGTLDPLATGLLLICLGAATRLSDYLRDKDKRYRARVRLGQTTDTYDADGQMTAGTATPDESSLPNLAAVEAALPLFRGLIQQRPPAYSAIKRGGQKAYELARRGLTVELEARPVEIFSLEISEWQPPEFTLDVHCGSGTYIRSLAHDLGQQLGCGAHLTALRRTASGKLAVSDAVPLAVLKAAFEAGPQAWRPYLRPADTAIVDWPALHLSETDTARIMHGQSIPGDTPAGELARAYNAAGEFFAILRLDPTKNVWRPMKVLV
jgi:tRNA pseudouridine55 synthase